jgi:hypothetical protein
MLELLQDADQIAARHHIEQELMPLLRLALAGSCVGRIQEGALRLDTLRETPTAAEVTLLALSTWGVLDTLPDRDRTIMVEVLQAGNRFQGDLSLLNPAYRLWKAAKDELRVRIAGDESLVTAEGILQQIEINILSQETSEGAFLRLRTEPNLRNLAILSIERKLSTGSSHEVLEATREYDEEARALVARISNYLAAPINEESLRSFEAQKAPPLSLARQSFSTLLLQHLSFPFDTVRDESALTVAKQDAFKDRIKLLRTLCGPEVERRVVTALNQHLSCRGVGHWISSSH